MMWWNILEVAPNADQKTIKQAYAKKLKQTRPDDNPEGFQALHSAYKQGLAVSSDAVYTNKTTKNIDTEVDSSQIAIIHTTENLDDQAKFENAKPINQIPQPTPEIIAAHLNRILKPESTANTYQPYYPTTDRHEINAAELNQDWQTFRQKFSLNLHQAQARKSAEAWHFLEELAFFNDF